MKSNIEINIPFNPKDIEKSIRAVVDWLNVSMIQTLERI